MVVDENGWPSDASFERLAIPPSEYDTVLTDINEKGLKEISDLGGIANLSPAEFPSVAFPVDGMIYGENNRLMVCLPCRRIKKPAATVNVWFIVDTTSSCNFLAKKTIEALICDDDPVPKALRVAMQDSNSQIECHMSSLDGHFAEANLLGMKALLQLELSIVIDWEKDRFSLVKK